MTTARPPRRHIPEPELSYRFSRSSGPGGQSVNTTDSKVELLWRVESSAVLTDDEKVLVTKRFRTRMVDGTVSIVAHEFKSQHRNREAARVRLEELVAQAVIPPKKRHATRPSKAARRRRLDAKKQRGQLKQLRRRLD